MTLESASALGIDAVVLAETPNESAARTASQVRIGSPHDTVAVRALAAEVDVVTFDHELVDLELLSALESEGMVVWPSSRTLLNSVDKAAMRRLCERHALPGPIFVTIGASDRVDVADLGQLLGWPLVLKAARGGYDGRGVYIVDGPAEGARVIDELQVAGTGIVAEAKVDIVKELAVLVARRPGGETVIWPAVETAQIGGVCREVLLPGSVEPDLAKRAEALARQIAEAVDLVGVMAVELFDTTERLLVNELAMRPHNSGHWTQDGSVTSQFENHLRAVLDLPLGSTSMTAPAVASVNIFGGPEGSPSLDDGIAGALAVPGAHVHLYGKETRPGRKLGHVTVTGEDAGTARRLAWSAAAALGTEVPREIGEQIR